MEIDYGLFIKISKHQVAVDFPDFPFVILLKCSHSGKMVAKFLFFVEFLCCSDQKPDRALLIFIDFGGKY